MAYKVVFLKGNESVGMTPWVDRDRAISHARQDFPLRQKKVGATAVHVVDVMTSETIFVLPEPDDRPAATASTPLKLMIGVGNPRPSAASSIRRAASCQ